MSQAIYPNIDPGTTSGIDLSDLLNGFKDAVASGFIGATRPPLLQSGGYWIDDSQAGSPNFKWAFRIYNGTNDYTIFTLNIQTGAVTYAAQENLTEITRISADSVGPILRMIKRRVANNGQVLGGDLVASVEIVGRTDTSGNPVVVKLEALALENQTSSQQGTAIVVYSTPQGAASAVEALRLVGSRVGLGGVTTPESQLHVRGSTGIRSENVGDNSTGAKLIAKKKRATGNQVLANDEIGSTEFKSTDDANADYNAAEIRATATQNHTASARGTKVNVYATKDGENTLTEAVEIQSKIETKIPLRQNSIELVSQDVATATTITALSASKPVVRMTGSTTTSIQGINASQDSKVLTIHNASTAAVTLLDEDTGASAANRISLPSANISVPAKSSVELFYDTTATRWKLKASVGGASGSAGVGPYDMSNIQVQTSVSGNALTFTIKTAAGQDPSVASPSTIAFKTTSAEYADYIPRSITSALSLTVPSGATLGHEAYSITNDRERVYLYAIDNAGTVELAVTSVKLEPNVTPFVSTTVLNTSSDSRHIAYSATARSSVAYRLLGTFYTSLATPGTWDEVPDNAVMWPNTEYAEKSSIIVSRSSTFSSVSGTTQITGLSVDQVVGDGLYFTSATDRIYLASKRPFMLYAYIEGNLFDGSVTVQYRPNGSGATNLVLCAGQSSVSKTQSYSGSTIVREFSSGYIDFVLNSALVRDFTYVRFMLTEL
jgi:hypothetical protein